MQRPSPLADATIVFDLDGTLVETAPDLMGTLNVLLARDGIAPLPADEARSLIGQGAKALLMRGFAAAGQPLSEARLSSLFDDFIDHYLAHIADESRPFEGVVEALDKLQSQGARLAVCTNKRTDLSLTLLNALGLSDRFSAIVGADAAPAPKPDPRHLTTAIERAGGRIDRAVMVGDSASDARAARNARVPLVLVSFGYTDIPVADLEPDILIDHFDALPDACARLVGTSLRV
ncbi:MAG: phosphoglycolate phosphatase [Caulobacteraceae bacterium]|nr:phosphoglycolate phosphatase [Caulobacteraceae bacterium]